MVWICTGEVCVRSSNGAGRALGQVQVEGVHIVAHGMKFRNVQRFEVVVRRFDFRAFDDGEANGKENVFDFLENLANQMVRANGTDDAGERKIDTLPFAELERAVESDSEHDDAPQACLDVGS